MFLFLDNSSDDKIEIRVYCAGRWRRHIFKSEKYQLLEAIDKAVKINQLSIVDLKGIAVVAGKGRFTAGRVATTVANTLAWACCARVVAVSEFGINLLDKIKRAKLGCFISNKYSGEANIGGQKNVK